MRKAIFVFSVPAICVVAWGLLTPHGVTAPALAEKSARFEYAELGYTRVVNPPPGGGQPGFPPPIVPPTITVTWTTADDAIQGTDWDDLANKLKAPAPKKDASPIQQRLRVFNRLGDAGWEQMEHTGEVRFGVQAWTFRRRLQ